ncbi:MAG: hypothetical protein ACRDU8_05400 [Egibacteraceae bacterium]
MEFVDFDEQAARSAIDACTTAADALDVAAGRLTDAAGDRLAAWSGASRICFDDTAEEIAGNLRTEAGNLSDTAEVIGQAILDAQQEDDRRRQEQLDAQREADRGLRAGGPR